MQFAVIPVFLFVLCALGLAVGLLTAGRMIGPHRSSPVKAMPYESGMDPIHDARRRFDVRFHLVAIAFLVFDVELLFLYPWAVASRNSAGLAKAVADAQAAGAAGFTRWLVFGEVAVFLGLLTLGFVYAWRK